MFTVTTSPLNDMHPFSFNFNTLTFTPARTTSSGLYSDGNKFLFYSTEWTAPITYTITI